MNINHIVDELLEERAQLLTSFCSLVGIDVWRSDAPQQSLGRFCQVLVDYAGMLHFELLSNLSEHEKDFPGLMYVAREIYEPCVATTQAMLDFNECYGTVRDAEQFSTAEAELSRLGEVLAERFEFEDELITAMHSTGYLESHSQEATVV